MSIKVSNYPFNGPYTSTSNIKDKSGVYAIHCCKNEKYYLLEVEESTEVKIRAKDHERNDCWKGKR